MHYGLHQDFKTSAFKFLPGVAEAIAEGHGAVEVSVDAGTRETYAKVKGVDALERVVANIGRYRERGPVNLKFIGTTENLADKDVEGFVAIATQTQPSVVTVTPEWSSSWKGEYGNNLTRQIAKLIYMLSERGLNVVPSTQAARKQHFPNFWKELESALESMTGQEVVAEKRASDRGQWI